MARKAKSKQQTTGKTPNKKIATRAAAEGERNAIRGFVPQYRWAAQNMLERWGGFTWVKMVDRQAGQVDDVVFGFFSNHVEAHQLKWSAYPGTFSWSFLFTAEKKAGKLSLVAQLADGWKRLRALYPNQAIVVRLVTNESPSNDRRSVSRFRGKEEPVDFHLAGFLVHVWQAIATDAATPVPDGWEKAWRASQDASGITDEPEFRRFVAACRIDYGSSLREPRNLQEASDLKDLTDLLFNEVAGKKTDVEFSREEVMQRLGWRRRFQVERSHDFPIPGNYRHLENTSRALEEAVRAFPSGYLMLEGAPGSGKSSLLSRFSPASAQVVRYFAYLPADQDPHRMTSGALLRDLSVSLSRANETKIARTLEPDDEGQLSRGFLKHLDDLHARYVTEGLKTIIIVDGLDHVERESGTHATLLSGLPDPSTLKDGVYLLLGSQTAQLSKLPPAAATALKEDGRIIPIARLPLTDVRWICANRKTETPLSAPQIERIAELADGHPLVLSYILNQVGPLATSALIDETLGSDQPFAGDLARYYEERWFHLEADDALVRLAGLLCRVRTAVELEWLAPKSRNDGVRFLRQMGHFFRPDGNGALSFFHDSLRQFLVVRTAQTYAGKFSPEQDRRYHAELADLCGAAPQSTVFSWEKIHHLEKSGLERELLALSTQEYFRQQFASLRPSSAIESDILVGLRTAAKVKDARAVCGLLLAGTELTQRKHNIEPRQIVPMLIQLGDVEHAIGYLVADSRRIASREVLLSASIDLSQRGHQREADRLLQMAEPWELLGGSAPIQDDVNGHQSRLVRLYVLAALLVRGYSAVRDVVPRIVAERTDSHSDDHRVLLERSTIFQTDLLRYAIELLLKVGRAQEAAEAFSDLKQTCQGSPNLFLRCANRIVEKTRRLGQTELANEWLLLVLRELGGAKALDLHLLYSFAVLELKLGWPDRRLSRLLVKEPEPAPYETRSGFTHVRDFEQFVPWLNHVYLRYAIGNEPLPQPLAGDPEVWTTGSLESLRRVAHDMAALAGTVRRAGASVDLAVVVSFLAPIIAFFSHWRKIQVRQQGRDDWMNAQHARRGLLVWALERACEICPNAIVDLAAYLSCEWEKDLVNWDPGAARGSVEVLIGNGLQDLAWARRWLDVIEPSVLDQEDAHTRVEEAMAQSEAWNLAGDAVRAKAALAKACAGSFGVGFRKDYQVDRWISWLGDALVAQPELAEERIAKLARWVAGMRQYTDGWKPTHFAALALIRQVVKIDSSQAVALASWFINKQAVWRDGLLASLIGDAAQENPSARDTGLQLVMKLVRNGDLNDNSAENLVLAFAGPDQKDLQTALKAARLIAKPITTDYDGRQVNEGIARALVVLGGAPGDMKWKEWPAGYRGSHLPRSDLHLPNGRKLTQDEVLQHVVSGDDLITLAEDSLRANSGDFNWAPVVRKCVHLLGQDHLTSLAQILSKQPLSGVGGGRESSHALSLISSALLERGSNSLAADTAEEALAAANHHWGWNTWGDGGTCLRALKAMAAADPERAQAAAFRALAADAEANFGMCFYAAEELQKILPILDPKVPRHELWPMVESLLSGLFELAYIEPDSPDLQKALGRASLMESLKAMFFQ